MDKAEQLGFVLEVFALKELLFCLEWFQQMEEAGKSSYIMLERSSRQKDWLVLYTDTRLKLKLGDFS